MIRRIDFVLWYWRKRVRPFLGVGMIRGPRRNGLYTHHCYNTELSIYHTLYNLRRNTPTYRLRIYSQSF